MSYLGMSVKEAVNNISGNVNGWFLPPVQRPYVWGSRYESEKYICKLFDSILRGYPIGGVILWNNEDSMPYREFLTNYKMGEIAPFVDKGLWERKDKWLIYDGQQRLQTLYSCLKYTLNGKVLVYNLRFNLNKEYEDIDATGFRFIEKNQNTNNYEIRMNELFVKSEDEKTKFRREMMKKINDNDVEKYENIIEENIDVLWDVFVKSEVKSIAYFPVKAKDETTVNEIFQRLNTGGVQLSQADLLLSKIKEEKYDFEENLQYFSKRIYDCTGKGYLFDQYQILQFMFLCVKGTTRVDPNKLNSTDIKKFIEIWTSTENALYDFFSYFVWESFKVNNQAIIPKKLALLPIMMFFKIANEKGINFKKMSEKNINDLKKYFIISQINDWNLQTIVDRFSRMIIEENNETSSLIFPIDRFIKYFEDNKQRNIVVYENVFKDYVWFSLKVVLENRVFLFEPDERGRFNPEIDHIFPKKLEKQDEEYYKSVDILWNMQPVKGEVNNLKRRKHPKIFFSTDEGRRYFSDYDFIPNIESEDWNDWKIFIENRKNEIKKKMKTTYDINLV